MCNNNCKGAYGAKVEVRNTTEVIPVAGVSAFEGYKAYNPDSIVTEKQYYQGEAFDSNVYATDEL